MSDSVAPVFAAVMQRHGPALLAFLNDVFEALGMEARRLPEAAPAAPKPKRIIAEHVRQASALRMKTMRAAGTMGRKPLISGARLEALREPYTAGTPMADLLAMLNAMPGKPVASNHIHDAAHREGLVRPILFRATVFPQERRELLRREYATADMEALLVALNELPGPMIRDLGQITSAANGLRLRRADSMLAPAPVAAESAPVVVHAAPAEPTPEAPAVAPAPVETEATAADQARGRKPNHLTPEREALFRRIWMDPSYTQGMLLAAINALDGTPYTRATSLYSLAGRLGLPGQRPLVTAKPAAAPAPAKPVPAAPAPVPAKPVPKPAEAPAASSDEDRWAAKLAKVTRMLGDGLEPSNIHRHTGIELREIYRIRGELREAARPA